MASSSWIKSVLDGDAKSRVQKRAFKGRFHPREPNAREIGHATPDGDVADGAANDSRATEPERRDFQRDLKHRHMLAG